jgi:hypothetical protein
MVVTEYDTVGTRMLASAARTVVAVVVLQVIGAAICFNLFHTHAQLLIAHNASMQARLGKGT